MNGTSDSKKSFHHGNVVLPGLIHEVSLMTLGAFSLSTVSDSSSCRASLPIKIRRQGDSCGSVARTAIFGSSGRGESRLTNVLPAAAWRARYMPA